MQPNFDKLSLSYDQKILIMSAAELHGEEIVKVLAQILELSIEDICQLSAILDEFLSLNKKH